MDDYALFKEKMKQWTGIDLSLYKETQMKRRLSFFAKRHGCDDFIALLKRIKTNPVLLESFLDKMTINVSAFFRNVQWWETFEEEILPKLLSRRTRLNIWSAACSTGEEPYTIAMILSKYTSDFSVLATDIDEQALGRAKKGFYTESSITNVPRSLRERCFEKQNLGYIVKNEIRQSVKFEKHNLLSDRYKGNFDFIACRNVLIYLVEEAKRRIYRNFHDSLTPGGVLFVGCTEQIFHPQQYGFEPLTTFFYTRP